MIATCVATVGTLCRNKMAAVTGVRRENRITRQEAIRREARVGGVFCSESSAVASWWLATRPGRRAVVGSRQVEISHA